MGAGPETQSLASSSSGVFFVQMLCPCRNHGNKSTCKYTWRRQILGKQTANKNSIEFLIKKYALLASLTYKCFDSMVGHRPRLGTELGGSGWDGPCGGNPERKYEGSFP